MLGSALGGALRYFLSGLIGNWLGASFPWGTVLVNISGSFAIGFFATLTGPDGRAVVGPHGRLFFMTGICGGYTTFSAFSLQTLNLAQEDEWLRAGANVVLSVVCCLIAVWLGHVAALALNRVKGS